MVRISILWFVISLLVGCASSPMPPAEPITNPKIQVQSQTAPSVIPPIQENSSSEVVVTPLQIPEEILIIEPHIALLLPLQSRDFAKVSEVVREGFQAAAKFQSGNPLSIKVYPLGNESEGLIGAYQKAIKSGAQCI